MKVFELKDKKLRLLIFQTIINNIDTMVKTNKFNNIETQLINLLNKLFSEGSDEMSRRILKMLIRLYYRHLWTSKKLINLIAMQIERKDQK